MHATYIYISSMSDTAHDSNEKGLEQEHFMIAKKTFLSSWKTCIKLQKTKLRLALC